MKKTTNDKIIHQYLIEVRSIIIHTTIIHSTTLYFNLSPFLEIVIVYCYSYFNFILFKILYAENLWVSPILSPSIPNSPFILNYLIDILIILINYSVILNKINTYIKKINKACVWGYLKKSLYINI